MKTTVANKLVIPGPDNVVYKPTADPKVYRTEADYKGKPGALFKQMGQAHFRNRSRKGSMPADPKVCAKALEEWLRTHVPTKCPASGSPMLATIGQDKYPKHNHRKTTLTTIAKDLA